MCLALLLPAYLPAQSVSAKPPRAITWKEETSQWIAPDKWVALKFNGETSITPTANGWAVWEWYINVDSRKTATKLRVRFVRAPNVLNDYTGETAIDLRFTDRDSHSWTFKGRTDEPVAVYVSHNGKKPLEIRTRQFKWVLLDTPK